MSKLETGVAFISAEAFVTDALAVYTAAVRASVPPRDHVAADGPWSSPQDFAMELMRGLAVRLCGRAANARVHLGVDVGVDQAGVAGFASDPDAGTVRGCGVVV